VVVVVAVTVSIFVSVRVVDVVSVIVREFVLVPTTTLVVFVMEVVENTVETAVVFGVV